MGFCAPVKFEFAGARAAMQRPLPRLARLECAQHQQTIEAESGRRIEVVARGRKVQEMSPRCISPMQLLRRSAPRRSQAGQFQEPGGDASPEEMLPIIRVEPGITLAVEPLVEMHGLGPVPVGEISLAGTQPIRPALDRASARSLLVSRCFLQAPAARSGTIQTRRVGISKKPARLKSARRAWWRGLSATSRSPANSAPSGRAHRADLESPPIPCRGDRGWWPAANCSGNCLPPGHPQPAMPLRRGRPRHRAVAGTGSSARCRFRPWHRIHKSCAGWPPRCNRGQPRRFVTTGTVAPPASTDEISISALPMSRGEVRGALGPEHPDQGSTPAMAGDYPRIGSPFHLRSQPSRQSEGPPLSASRANSIQGSLSSGQKKESRPRSWRPVRLPATGDRPHGSMRPGDSGAREGATFWARAKNSGFSSAVRPRRDARQADGLLGR